MKDLVEAGVVSMSGTLSVLQSGEPVTSEQIFRTGKRAVITSTPVFDGDDKENLVMVVTLVREITEIYSIRKELQRKEQQNRQYMQELERMRKELDGDVELVAVAEPSRKLLEFARKMAPSFPNRPLMESASRYRTSKRGALSVPAVPGIQRPLI